MKKLLAVLLALVLALSCTLALAETTAPATEQEFPGLTIESEYDVNREAITKLLTDKGMDESLVKFVDAIASILDQGGEKLVIAKDGVQCDVLLKGESLVNLLAQFTDNGLLIGSNLIPNYALTASFEELFELFMAKVQEQAEATEGFDIAGIQESLSAHVETFVDSCSAAIIPGEPKQGDYVMDGVSYNTMIPMKIDLPTIVDALNEMTEGLANDETIQTALLQLALMGVEVNFDAGSEAAFIDKATLPAVAVETYVNVDENGAQNGPTQVIVYVVPAGETEAATVVTTKVNDTNVTVDAQFISANTTVTYTMDRDPQDMLGIKCRLDAYVKDAYYGFAAVTASTDESITFDAYLYALDQENAIAEEHGSITMNGQLTASVSDKATVLTLSDLTGEKSSDNVSGLVMDMMFSGLGGVLSTATELMPDEVDTISSTVTSILNMFTGSAEDAQPAA